MSTIGFEVKLSFESIEVPFRFIEENLKDLGLERFVPRQPNPADVFRRITGKITRTISHEDGTKTYLDVKSVTERVTDGDNIERAVFMTDANSRTGEITDGLKVARILFDRETEQFVANYGPFGDFHYCPHYVKDIVKEILSKYNHQITMLSFQQVTGMFKNIALKSGSPVWAKRKTSNPNEPLKLGVLMKGCYNIPATRDYIAEALEELAERINRYAEANEMVPAIGIDINPITDSDEKKTGMTLDFIQDACNRLDSFLEDERRNIVRAQDTEKATIRAKKRFEIEVNKTMELINECETLLGRSMEEVRAARTKASDRLHRFCDSPKEQVEFREELKLTRRIRTTKSETIVPDIPDTPKRLIRVSPELQGSMF